MAGPHTCNIAAGEHYFEHIEQHLAKIGLFLLKSSSLKLNLESDILDEHIGNLGSIGVDGAFKNVSSLLFVFLFSPFPTTPFYSSQCIYLGRVGLFMLQSLYW